MNVRIEEDRELRIAEHDGMAMVQLNRPKALNALTLEMIRILSGGLISWENNKKVKAIVINGAGRAFCAGGDIKAAYATGMDFRRGEGNEKVMALYYGEEYEMNRRLFHFRKPLIAFMNGITMGGGFGVAGPCRFRVATEKTVFAMPEVGIGFFPDVGSVYFLNNCPHQTGTYLAVTGNSIGPEDMIYTGLATHYIPSSILQEVEEDLCRAMSGLKSPKGDSAAEQVAEVLEKFSSAPPKKSMLEQNAEAIEKCFAHNSIMEILEALRWQDSEWALDTARTIMSRSPISVVVSLEHLRRAHGQDFDTVLARDFILAQHFLKEHDFYEGVRAAVIDKDKQPQWDPATLENITEKDVARYFAPAAGTLEAFAI
ncbi:MAG TPA: enoyl-CoA hydratase/isomerase family protein [Patescibacteria group bacterium]|nr:enoyl-CoA hydratase/isomerase family protein [Patescibacteria group bacterium]